MSQETSFASIEHIFSQGAFFGEDFMDEKTWNSLSQSAKQVILEISKTSVEYIDTAVESAISGDIQFPYECKEILLRTMQQQNKENEVLDKQKETITQQFL